MATRNCCGNFWSKTLTTSRRMDKSAYQSRWAQARRAVWLRAHGPCRCGSWDRLQVDHIDPRTKVSHRVWSWADERRLAELAKCQALCYDCHAKKSSVEKRAASAKLTPEQVAAIKARIATGERFRLIAAAMGASLHMVKDISSGRTWIDS